LQMISRRILVEFIVLIIIVVVYGIATYQRNLVWKTGNSIWTNVVQKSPGKSRPHNNLGLSYLDNKQCKQAIAQFQESLRIQPNFMEARYNLGMACQILRLYHKAIVHYEDALYKLKCLSASGDETSAKFYLGELYNNLGVCYFAIRKPERAVSEFQKVIKVRPDHVNARYNLARVSKWKKGAKKPDLIQTK